MTTAVNPDQRGISRFVRRLEQFAAHPTPCRWLAVLTALRAIR